MNYLEARIRLTEAIEILDTWNWDTSSLREILNIISEGNIIKVLNGADCQVKIRCIKEEMFIPSAKINDIQIRHNVISNQTLLLLDMLTTESVLLKTESMRYDYL